MKNIRSFQGVAPTIGKRVFIDPSAIVIGQATIGDDVALWPGVIVRADMHHITIGPRTNIQDGSVLHVTHASDKTHPDGFPLIIGADITVGHRAMLHGCHIQDRCLIGMNTIIMDGAIVESEVIIGAGSLVSPGKVLESGYLYVGRPAVKVRPLNDAERAFIPYSVQNYCNLKDIYLKELEDGDTRGS
ncbi:MAG: gamma carbonic anhydrase family protein [Legionellales bacterium]|nr:gamma carbonic anhydrase family protein [Legionellales bacterium]